MEWCFLVIFYSLLLASLWAGRLRSDYFYVMLVLSAKAQFWKKIDKSIKGRVPWPGTAILVSLSRRLPQVTFCCPVSGGMNWRENCTLGFKFKESWEQARFNKLWGVSCLHWAKALVAECVCNKLMLGQFDLHCTSALPSKMAALSLDSRFIFT